MNIRRSMFPLSQSVWGRMHSGRNAGKTTYSSDVEHTLSKFIKISRVKRDVRYPSTALILIADAKRRV